MMVGSLQSSFLLAYAEVLTPGLIKRSCLPSATKSFACADVQHGRAIAMELVGPSHPARSSLSGEHLCTVQYPFLLALGCLQQVV